VNCEMRRDGAWLLSVVEICRVPTIRCTVIPAKADNRSPARTSSPKAISCKQPRTVIAINAVVVFCCRDGARPVPTVRCTVIPAEAGIPCKNAHAVIPNVVRNPSQRTDNPLCAFVKTLCVTLW